MGSKKESSTQSRNIFQTTQANINTPRNLFAGRQQAYSKYIPSDRSISWESQYLDPGCINNYQSSWYGSKYGVNLPGAPNLHDHGNTTGGFLCRGINEINSMSTTVTCTSGRGISSINNPVNCNTLLNTTQSLRFNTNNNSNNINNNGNLSNTGYNNLSNTVVQLNLNDDSSMDTDDPGYCSQPTMDGNNALDITPSISADIHSSMNSFEMITDLKNGVDLLTDVNDPNDILSKLNSQYSDQRVINSPHQTFTMNGDIDLRYRNGNQDIDTNYNNTNQDMDMQYTTNENCCGFDEFADVVIKEEIKRMNNDNLIGFGGLAEAMIKEEIKRMDSDNIDDIFLDNDFNIPSIQWAAREDDEHIVDDEPSTPEEVELTFSLPSPQPDAAQENISEMVDTKANDSLIQTTERRSSSENISTSEINEATEVSENVEKYFDENGDTVLHAAIHRQNIEEALEILQKPEASVIANLRNNSKEVPILLALKRFADQCSLLLDKLLQLRANVNVQDQSGNNIFHLILLQTRSEESCLSLLAILFNHVKYEESYKVLINKRNVDSFCASHIATVKRYGKVVSLLKKNGADLDIQDHKSQRTCIVMAAEDRNWALVKELIDMNVDVNIATNANMRAVNYAIKYEEVEMIELLFKHRTDVYKWKERTTPKEIIQLVEKLIRKKRRQRQKKDTQVERPA